MLVLCRVGGCLMLLPGFGSVRIPVRLRIWLAVAVALTIFPFIYKDVAPLISAVAEPERPLLLVSETIIGLSLGLLSRVFVLGLQFSATLLTNVIGLAATPGAPVDDAEPVPPLVSLVSLGATTLIFAANLHHEFLRAILQSYDVIKVAEPLDPGWHVDRLLTSLDESSIMALRLSGPFIVYSIVVNLAIGFANKFTPQISVYFMTTGMVAAAGLLLFYFISDEWFGLFLQDFAQALK
jgi:flagellar biosynthetic protein FliR